MVTKEKQTKKIGMFSKNNHWMKTKMTNFIGGKVWFELKQIWVKKERDYLHEFLTFKNRK